MVDIKETLEGAAFGTTDGIICALGTIIGAAAATESSALAIIAGVLAGVSNSFANGIGVYVSQTTESGVQKAKKSEGKEIHVHSVRENIISAVSSFSASIVVSLIMVAPFAVLPSISSAMLASFFIGTILLFVLGAYTAKISNENMLWHGVQYALLGVAGSLLGYFIGEQLRGLLLVPK